MAKQTPLSIILSLLDSLSERDKTRLKNELMRETPCELKGHNMKVVSVTNHLFAPPTTKMVCIKCAKEIIV